jgi:hypothetical protein
VVHWGSKYGIEVFLEVKYLCMGASTADNGSSAPGTIRDRHSRRASAALTNAFEPLPNCTGRTPVSEPSYQRSADHFAFGATAELRIDVIEIDQARRGSGFNAEILAIAPISSQSVSPRA